MDVIHIRRLEIFANHGVIPEENTLGQKFIISADLYKDLRAAGKTDNLKETIHYGRAAVLIKQISEKSVFQLIEKLAEEIADALLKNFPLENVKIVIEKPWAPVRLPLDTVAVEIERSWHTVYLSIGSNIGDREQFLKNAIKKLDNRSDSYVTKVSGFIETEPYGNVQQDKFLNGCLELRTLLSPSELLKRANEIEQEEGRVRTLHWGPRTLDIDILLYDNETVYTDDLKIPHIDMHNRMFVLKPLCEIAPFTIHPVLGKSVMRLKEKLEEKEAKTSD
ncbi:MAG: 2-amino-4-hydroxy-6-hydroxymethyldihydropteridine diphosphokinase [Lachnospiraceae bacterium]|nr:2-amino-4-hydroxy-6-hydroxymethyldihydropteridine diphosphokinase [Lachnospiraceae bacterium]